MKRRHLTHSCSLPATCFVLAAIATYTVAFAAEPKRPNIVLIVADDMGWPDLGIMGLKPIKTPHLDRLAAEGVRLTNFYVTWPACTPSRGSILTGRHPLRNGLYAMVRNDLVNYRHRYTELEYATSPEMTLGLDVREKTLGDLLRQAGYRTGMVGKWDMGQAKRFLPLQRGFDFFYGHGNNGIDYYTHERYGIHSMFAGNARTKEDQGNYATDLFQREALRFIGNDNTKPWFLYLCFNAPHGASSYGPDPANPRSRAGVQAPEKYVALYENSDVPENLRRYYAAVTAMDDAIGAVMQRLRDAKMDDNTLVMFMSDNGGSGNGGNAPLKGGKSSMWEGGLRVPFVARWPGQITGGRVSDEFLTALELFPTLAGISGAKPPAGVTLDGYDMLATLKGEAPSPRRDMFWERLGDKAVRSGKFKWIASEKASGLYDLSADPGEKNDLSEQMPDIARKLESQWAAWRQEMEAAEPRGPFRDY